MREPSIFVMGTFKDGETLGEGLHLLTSVDGRSWKALPGDPIVLKQGLVGTVFRDPTLIFYDGWFHLAFTTELCAGIPTLSFSCDWHLKQKFAPPPRFGYARSRDLIWWEDVRGIEVQLTDACNIWAPEWFVPSKKEATALGGNILVVFSATVTSPCPPDFGPHADASVRSGNAQKPFIMSTSDFHNWTAPKLLFNPHESAIDTFLFRAPHGPGVNGGVNGPAMYALYKAEQNACDRWQWNAGGLLLANTSCTLALRLSRAPSLLGPFSPAPLGQTPLWSNAISRQCAEGPSVLRMTGGAIQQKTGVRWAHTDWLVLYDGYRGDCQLATNHVMPCRPIAGEVLSVEQPFCTYTSRQGFGALQSPNLRDWQDVSDGLNFPKLHKHGTAMRLSPKALCSICTSQSWRRGTGLSSPSWAGFLLQAVCNRSVEIAFTVFNKQYC